MNRSDSQLVSDYLRGDELALKKLIDKYISSVYNFVYRFGGVNDSDDITQEVFIKVWKNLKKFDPEQSFKTWLFSIARNTTIDWMRKRRNVNFSDLDNDIDSFEESIKDPGPLADELVAITQNKTVVENLLETLPVNYRTVLILYYMEDMTFKEISKVLDKSIDTVKSQHRRALIQLKQMLEDFRRGNGAPKL